MKGFKILLVVLAAFLLMGAGDRTGGEIFCWEEGMGTMWITNGERWYMSWPNAVEPSDLGQYLGHMDNSAEDRVYTYKDYPREKWLLLRCVDSDPMLFKELHNVDSVPEELIPEDSWWEGPEEPPVYDDYEPKLPDEFGFWFWIILPVGIFFCSPAGPIIALMLVMGIWLTVTNEKLSKRRKNLRTILQAVPLVLIIAGGIYFWALLL